MSLQGRTTLKRTLGEESDEVFEFNCDSSFAEHKNKKATGHCLNCNENLCDECITCHKKLNALRNHVIENNPRSITNQPTRKAKPEDSDPLTDRCRTHSNEFIKFFCHSHKTLACSDCITLNHHNCKDVSHIRDISDDIGTSDEFITLQTGLRRLEATFTKYKSSFEKTKVNILESYSRAVEELKQLKSELDKMLHDLEDKLLESALDLKNEQISCLDNNSTTCQEMMNETMKQLEDLQDKMEQGHNDRLFISIKQAQDSISQMTKQSESIGEKCRPHRLSFRRNEQVTNFLHTLKNLGDVLLSKEPGYIKVKYERDINVKTKTDNQDCHIIGAILLPDGRLCLCDCDNKSIKMMNRDTVTISNQLTLPGGPIDATMINDKELTVIIKGDKNLQIVSVSPTLRPSRTIHMPEQYNGIAYCDDKLLLTCWNNTIRTGGVDICDMSGNIIMKIETDMDGTKLFTFPFSLCVSPDKALIYVTDKMENTVVTMDMEGSVINVYKNDDLKRPTGITADEYGTVYVCSHDNSTVHQLSRTGHLEQILFNQKDGIKYPAAIAYKTGKLYISGAGTALNRRNNIMVFSLTEIRDVKVCRNPANIKVKYERDIYVKTTTDKQICHIREIVFLPDGRLCLCDFLNKSIKLMETDSMTISDQLTLPAGPKNATMINDKELAVIIAGDENLQIVSVSPTLRPSRTIPLPEIYNGIAYCEDKLLLTWRKIATRTGGVDICDMSGNIIMKIETDVDGTKLFTDSLRLCVSPDKTLIYVTDCEENTVVTMDMEGSVINVYKSEELKEPIGITVDEDGTVYVCSNDNSTIHQLTRTGHLVKILLSEMDGIKYPVAIAYKAGKLYISSGTLDPTRCNHIRVFSVTEIRDVKVSRNPANIKVKYERDIYVKRTTDKQICHIREIVFLPDGRLCLCDFLNKSIKLMETDNMTISDQLTLPAVPNDVTVVNDKELAVIIAGDENLQIVSVSPTLRPSRTIPLPEIYNGIAYCEDKLLLTWWDDTNGGVDICDMSGNRIKRIMTDMDGTKLFTHPYRLCTSPDKTLIYVTDFDEYTVVTMDMEGSVINVYKNKDLKRPTGITVDEDGTVYVCSLDNHTVHQLTWTGHLVHILLTEKDGIRYPAAIAYKTGKLYISSTHIAPAHCDNIKVFSLK